MNREHNVTRVVFTFIAIMATIWVLHGFISPPSNHAYNPHTPYTSHNEKEILRTFKELNKIASEDNAAEASSSFDIEAWTASRSDLAAQWETADMAHLAFRMGLLGIILLSWTLFETRNASDSAAETLKIAENTLYETKKTNKRAQRAYIGIEKAYISKLAKGSQVIFHIWLKNYGTTPAKLLSRKHTVTWVDDSNTTNFEKIIDNECSRLKRRTIINPSEHRRITITSKDSISQEDILVMALTQNFLASALSVKYSDIFGNIYELNFIGVVSPDEFAKNDSLTFTCDEEFLLSTEINSSENK